MTDAESLFFHFVRKGLWGAEEKGIDVNPACIDWKKLFEMAYAQAVTGLFIDGVAYTSMRPDDTLWEKWIVHLFHIEQANEFIAGRGKWWMNLLGASGIQATIFKGSSVAVWYPIPSHRSYGDIDIVITGKWQNLPAVLQSHGLPYRYEWDEIVLHDQRDVLVEFHKDWEYLYNPISKVRFRRMCSQHPPTESKELYLASLILHLRRHFLTYGIGLKQVCDVAVMLRHADLDRTRTAFILRRLHAGTFSRLLFGFISLYIGGIENYPLPPVAYGKRFTLLCNVILHDGYRLKKKQEAASNHSHTSFSRIVGNAWFWLRRSFRLLGIMPDEACCFFCHMTKKRIRLLFSRKFRT